MPNYEDNGDGFLTRNDTLMEYAENETHVVIPAGIAKIKADAFANCDKMKTLTIPKSVKNIDPYAFSYCKALEDFIVEDGNPVYKAGEHCLINVKKKTFAVGLKNAAIPADGSIDKIGKGAFSTNGCNENIIIPDGVTEIGSCAFCGCDIKNITLPPSVKTVWSAAFAMCRKLETVVISEGTVSIGDSAFEGCEKLRSVKLPESLVSIDDKAFYLCENLQELRIPSALESIGELAFSGCDKWIGELFIPKSLTKIGGNSLFEKDNVIAITVEPGNAVYHSSGNCLIDTAEKKVVFGCKNSVIPDDGSVTEIGFCAFGGCKELKEIVIPKQIEKVGMYAFSDSGLKTVTIYKDLDDFEDIESYAFEYNVKFVKK